MIFLSDDHKSIKPDKNVQDYLYENVSSTILKDRYLMPEESIDDMYARVANVYSDDHAHAERLFTYMKNKWFSPATPVLSNGGTKRGLAISCFLNDVEDSLLDIVEIWNENIWLATSGGGIGTYWGDVRSIGETVKGCGQTSGIIPFIKVMDSLTLAISQGSLRRGSAAVYLDIFHPEIEEFLEIRKPSGDFNRKSLNLHHGILINDKFMEAVIGDKGFDLISPKTKKVQKTVNARHLWQKILELRIQTGEPYIIYIDTVNEAFCKYQKNAGLKVKTSNLCSEIMLATGYDKYEQRRTAVCCLSSLNLATVDNWFNNELFIEDVMRFLDNSLEDFISQTNIKDNSLSSAGYSAYRERSIGLGVMGFHSYLMQKGIPIESPLARSWNMQFFQHFKKEVDKVSIKLAEEKGPCPDAYDAGVMERFSHKTAIAPTASISLIAGCVSPSIEPISATIYTQKTLSGSFTIKNPYLSTILLDKYRLEEDIWHDILEHQGSVQHLDFLTQHEKDIFKTAFEINQFTLIDLAADRTPYICQGQSTNIFLNADVSKERLHMIHWMAWKKGLKSLYYCRSRSINKTAFAFSKNDKAREEQKEALNENNYEECTSCQ